MKNFLKVGLLLLLITSASHAMYAQGSTKAVGYGLTSGRAKALVGVAVGLISLVVGGMALARAKRRIGNKGEQTKSIVALALGLIGIILSLIHLGNATGGFGTGGGRAGAIVALIVGLTGMILGGLSLARHKGNAKRNVRPS